MRDGLVPWPDDVARRYTEAGHWRGQPLGSRLWEWAERSGADPALVDGDVRLSYRELAETADGLAQRLSTLGLRAGQTVLVQLPNCWELVTLTLACFRLGVAPLMALPAHRGHELRHLAALAEVTAIAVPDQLRGFDHQALAHDVAAATPSVQHVLVVGEDVTDGSVDLRPLARAADDLRAARATLDAAAPSSRDVAVFLLSGGTTGLPKLISRTHDDYEYNARRSAEVCGFDASTRYLVALPAGHNFPLACPGILGTFSCGGTVVLVPSPEPERAFAVMAAEGVTVTAVVPAVAQRWIEVVESGQLPSPDSLRLLQVGGSRLVPELARRVTPALGCRLQQVFGMAEGLLNYTRLDDPGEVVEQTQGRPMSPDDEVRIVDEDGHEVPPGASGALLTRGPYTPRGYYRAAEHNERAFTEDGWYRTGDVVRWHPTGNLVVEGRDKDMINRGGEKISAEEVEDLVYRVAGVSRVAAVAVPDPGLGERVCVAVVAAAGADPTLEGIRAALTDLDVARYKLPEHLVLLDELPLTKVGKVDKQALRDIVRDRQQAPTPTERTDTQSPGPRTQTQTHQGGPR
jgi:2,3-dihydroxybenzoate-AMP ligase